MTRVAFIVNFYDRSWMGAINYFRNLFDALNACPESGISPVGIVSPRVDHSIVGTFSLPEIHHTRWADEADWRWKLRRAFALGAGRDWILERMLEHMEVDLLSHVSYLGCRARLPSLPWIPDFQELYLPEFFTESQLAVRNKINQRLVRHAPHLLLSSEHAREGLAMISQPAADRAHVLPFVVGVPSLENLPTRQELESRHGPLGNYFFLPNQFWVHKNHQMVLQALAFVRRQGKPLKVIATGNLEDYRQPGHGQRILRLASELGIEQDFQVLGMVPYSDLMGLMAQAVAVINPSLFEGWSTTVEEAKSMGKAVLLSDIAVHREQQPERGRYFSPQGHEQLAELMLEADAAFDPNAETVHMRQAAERLPLRFRDFAERYRTIVTQVTRLPKMGGTQ